MGVQFPSNAVAGIPPKTLHLQVAAATGRPRPHKHGKIVVLIPGTVRAEAGLCNCQHCLSGARLQAHVAVKKHFRIRDPSLNSDPAPKNDAIHLPRGLACFIWPRCSSCTRAARYGGRLDSQTKMRAENVISCDPTTGIKRVR